MPQSGDGDLWPRTDDDTRSTRAKDAETHELPVPDQQKQRSAPTKAKGGWFDAPEGETPAAPGGKRDEPHPGPEQQITQPVSWPVADLERQAAGEDPVRAFSRPLPRPGDEKTAIVERPAWPAPEPKPDSARPGADRQEGAAFAWPAGNGGRQAAGEDSQPDAADADEQEADARQETPDTGQDDATEVTGARQDDAEPDSGEQQPRDREDTRHEEPGFTQTGETEGDAQPGSGQQTDENAPREASRPEPTAPGDAPSRHGSDDVQPGSGGQQSRDREDFRPQAASGEAPSRHDSHDAQPGSGGQQSRDREDFRLEAAPGDAPSRHGSHDAQPGSGGQQPRDREDLQREASGVSGSGEGTGGAQAAATTGREDVQHKSVPAQAASGEAPSRHGSHDAQPGSAGQRPRDREDLQREASGFSRSGDGSHDAQPGATTGRERGPQPEANRQEDAPTSFVRPVGTPHKEDSRPEAPRPEDAPTGFVRPVGGPRQEGTQPPPSFLRHDNGPRPDNRPDNTATSFIPRGPGNGPQTPARRENPPSFTRNTDSATVNLTRQEPDRRAEWPPPEPPRAAPQRVGPQPEPAEPEPRPEKKTRKPLLVAAIAIAAVIAIAAGVVFGVPGLSDKLGLTGEDPVAAAPPPAPVSYTPALHGPDAATAGPTRQGVEQAIAGAMADPALGNVNGIVIDPATGETLYEKNPDGATTPASTGKILTAAAALLSLDPTEQLVTKVVEGEQPGEVIIVGGGDPTISSLEVGKESIYPGAAHLSELVDQVKAAGTRVQTVYIDQSRYTAPGLAPSWLPADVGAGYITPIVPAMLDGDRQGDATENYSPRTTDPGRTLVNAFANRIGASPADSIEKKAPENAKVLGEIRSAPMTQLVDNMLNRSENTLADVLAHEVAVEAGEEPNFDGASKAMLDVLRENGFDVEGVVLRDGSGMSEENKMTARLLAEVLAVAASPDGKDPRTAKLRPLLGGLPVAGGSGTLADRYTEADSVAGKGWVRAKTGSLTGINSLAGIVLDKDNRPLVFAFLTSGTVATSARPALDSVTAALRGCGCR